MNELFTLCTCQDVAQEPVSAAPRLQLLRRGPQQELGRHRVRAGRGVQQPLLRGVQGGGLSIE